MAARLDELKRESAAVRAMRHRDTISCPRLVHNLAIWFKVASTLAGVRVTDPLRAVIEY
jgi:hypothetical protein